MLIFNRLRVRIHFSSGFRDTVKGNITNRRRRLRLCPRANKNLHIPAGYAESILLHNICLQGATPRAFPQNYPTT
ncbi:hypothetical protein T01_14127 [Trichinella spiralis]|uniref:Uncharacterized protein n=1 Tax=Trichinella spiralis TaxID=6334 RepID=A0A0V1BK78_TRISP|nr:hypothetical protein T01_14127 [Trichinella spiralis]